ncbi:MAG: tRNA (N(6)-L-threonylcarbamoyladenosine(37)-C(2))-methylthiotransferase MtaB [Phascolarctobacterium sp.]|nr:tRNA (N(6)-L-threonylcarbamoyladenosine(37)-C(2))-methylthiotransferase MtaB [Candidatus Phascolarctobacterium caballi]
MKKIAFNTLGCKVNQADTASMEVLFSTAGYVVVDFSDEADVYLINTCVVTNEGQRKSRQMINRVIRQHPKAIIVVTGCYPQTAFEEVANIAGVDVVVGNMDRQQIVGLVEKAIISKNSGVINGVKAFAGDDVFDDLSVGNVHERTRAFLKIQEGCNQFCTYCIIPYARGGLRSRSLEGISTEVTKLVGDGYREIVLIGIHLGCYGKEKGDVTLFDAVQTALNVDGVERLRLGSLESVEVEERLLELMAKDLRLCRHLHLPLQSGCDKILNLMHRPYNTEKFEQLISKIRQKIPDIAITTDVIVGFPGETEQDFDETMNFVKKIGFAKMHIFPYSKRCGTPAANFAGQLTEAEKALRVKQLGILDIEMQKAFMQSMIGKTVQVLFEQETDTGCIEGHSGNYQLVCCEGNASMVNKIAEVEIVGIKGKKLFGKIKNFIERGK